MRPEHNSLPFVSRILGYAVNLCLSTWVAVVWFGGNHAATLSLFILFSLCFELMFTHFHQSAERRYLYYLCVALVLLSGISMLGAASKYHLVQGAYAIEKTK